ncbi:MAG: hypothetical protein ACJ71T_12445 [Actinomycetales bacterium]
MTILDRLSAVPGTYWGSGDGPHSGPFIARVTVTTTKAGAIDLDYEAWTQGAGLQHAERAVIRRADSGHVILESTLAGQAEPLSFQEGQPGVFGSLDGQMVGVVIDIRDGTLSWAWWWTAEDDQLKEQSRAVVRRLLEPVAPPESEPEAEPAAESRSEAPAASDQAEDEAETPGATPSLFPTQAPEEAAGPVGPVARPPVQAPWPGVLVLTGMGGVAALARDLAKEVPSMAVVRGDLLARAIVGTEVSDDRDGGAGLEWRARLAARLSREYAELGHAVVLAELESSGEAGTTQLLEELDDAGVGPVRLLVVDETTSAVDVLSELPRPGRRRSL